MLPVRQTQRRHRWRSDRVSRAMRNLSPLHHLYDICWWVLISLSDVSKHPFLSFFNPFSRILITTVRQMNRQLGAKTKVVAKEACCKSCMVATKLVSVLVLGKCTTVRYKSVVYHQDDLFVLCACCNPSGDAQSCHAPLWRRQARGGAHVHLRLWEWPRVSEAY